MQLPNGWKEVKLGNLMSFKNGLNFTQVPNGIVLNFLGVGNFKFKKVISSENELEKISLANLPNEDYLLKEGDLVFVRSNGSRDLVGRCVKMLDSFSKTTFSGFCIRGRLVTNKTTPDYILYLIECGFLREKLKKESRGTNISNLNQDILNDFDVLLPPLAEQKKIAETLSTWDSAIEKMEKLIDEKENLFKVELKAKIIVRGFEENWEKFTVKDCVVALTPPSRISQDNYKKTGNFPVIDQSKEPIAGWTNDENCIIRSSNPLIIFGDHTCILKIMKIPFAQGADGIKVLSANDRFDAPFLYYSLKADPVVPEGYKRHYSSLQRKEVFCPSKDIQKKLARYFEIKDKELSLLKQQLALYKKQKQGLMQKLLTGEWRVK